MVLGSHSGAGDETMYGTGPDAKALQLVEAGGFLSQRAIAWLVFSGVFERHPALKLILCESPGDWWPYLMKQLDSAAQALRTPGLAQKPSEYCRRNVFHGATFISRDEALRAVDEGYDTNVLWGSDYPHVEGTWQNTGDGSSMSVHQLRWALSGLPDTSVRRICGDNAIDALGLDRNLLATVAARISAPTLAQLAEPLDRLPDAKGMFAYRTQGPFV
jgi:predicted TIM-barrel fold metal-dependent hydrolase